MRKAKSGPVTLLDVAREAGVSLATASRVINGSERRRPAPELAEKVTEAAQRLGYTVNAAAQAIARGVTSVVGLIVSDIADPYFSSIAAGVTEEAERHGLLVTLASTKGRPEREVDYLAALRRQRPLAIVLVGSRRTNPATEERLVAELRSLRDAGGRAAAISQPALDIDTVVVRNAEGAAELGHALVKLGHRRFGVLGGPADLRTAVDRVAGFTGSPAGAGIADVHHGAFTRDGGRAAALELLRRTPDLDCLFAVNDVMAIGAMAAARELGHRVPEDLAIAGFDDIPSAADTFPPLSTVRIDLEAMGRDAMRLVLVPAAEPAAPRVEYATGTVVLRASTKR
jgi:LacI family transcriptional regulator, galactose operon repressor